MNFLNKKIFSFDDKFLGLDLSDISVKVLELEKIGKNIKVRSFSEQKIPEGAVENGIIIKKDLVKKSIQKAISESKPKKVNSRNIICSLPESKAFLRIISIPKMKEEEASEAVKWEIEASIPLSIDKVYFDWQFINNNKKLKDEMNQQDVLTVAVSKDVVDQLIEISEEINLSVSALEIESIATARSLINKREVKNEASLIVDLGARRTSFIVIEKDIPYFTSSIPFSSEGLTDVIAKFLNVSNEEAEKIKINKGIVDFEKDEFILKAIEPLLSNLIGEIEKTIDFYANTEKNNREIERIILCGGGSNLKGLVPYLTKKLSKQVEEGDPWTNLRMGSNLPPINRDKASGYATVVGLAMREMDYEN